MYLCFLQVSICSCVPTYYIYLLYLPTISTYYIYLHGYIFLLYLPTCMKR